MVEERRPDVEVDLAKPDHTTLTIEASGVVVGMIRWWEETTPITHQCGIDMFLHPDHHHLGLRNRLTTNPDPLASGARRAPPGDHRPATGNLPAIAAYEKIRFQRIGVAHEFWKDRDEVWRDSLPRHLFRGPAMGPLASGPGMTVSPLSKA
ncbi:GNAT family N-acetyltransferase [Streptomyces albipurpureus]|uniref:GNAT family N-acetyltransferase n=1 Tax=Streptomyces albipurpureus TaxID=2897419 RepID=A0ABT0UN08_9ACTN|nr:hypothetical protein [Streptomyces sp. CWNU-1]MCM2389716.1 hypothetical protein [Streptomyces sp. CWNU-1]